MKIRELLTRETLPDRSYFKSSEVASLLNVKPQEIWCWEAEFPQIRSQKNKSGKRIYLKDDVILLGLIKHLLQEKKFTIAGAQKILAESYELMDGLSSTRELANTTYEKPDSVAEALVDGLGNQDSDLDCAGNFVLESASELLVSQEDSFDETAHEIHGVCGQELDAVCLDIEPEQVGEMISDAMVIEKNRLACQGLNPLEYEKALTTLLASKESLTELINSLDRFQESDFVRNFDRR